ncbi:MAG: carboxylesterase [Legionellaceae bacterium]|nr:carboxylesterase [Legionellaceae bacterium]
MTRIIKKSSQNPARACILWMHGLGATAGNLSPIAEDPALRSLAIQHIFLQAPKRPVTISQGMLIPAWYDIEGLELSDRDDEEGILASQATINAEVETLIAQGWSSSQIFLGGFSQGGAMALYTGIHSKQPLAGIIALSAYLPLLKRSQALQSHATPFFMAYGSLDPIVRPAWTQHTADHIQSMGYHKVSLRNYPMEHCICNAELSDLGHWLQHVLLSGNT